MTRSRVGQPPATPDNPPISRGLRIGMAIAVTVVCGGGLLLFVPDRAERWVWTIGPFNSRFLGAVYLCEMAGGLVLVVVARHFPARTVVPVALTFTGVVFLASLLSTADFDFARKGPWLWFLAYGGFTAFLPLYAWHHFARGPQPPPTSKAWRRWFAGEGVLLATYGLGLLVAPEPLTRFWPWRIDAFHGRIYSAIFLTFAVGSFILSRRITRLELQAVGISRLVLGVLAVVGLILADRVVGTVDWGRPGTVIWTVGFGVMAGVGLAMMLSKSGASPFVSSEIGRP